MVRRCKEPSSRKNSAMGERMKRIVGRIDRYPISLNTSHNRDKEKNGQRVPEQQKFRELNI